MIYKAITLYQPWASLIAVGAKKYETRGWKTNYRGPIAIHAGKKPYNLGDIDFGLIRGFMSAAESALGIYEANNAPLGAIVATADLVGCHEITGHRTTSYGDNGEILVSEHCTYLANRPGDITGDELLFGNWEWGRYAWELANVTMLPEPIPAKGRQGLWNWEG